MDIMNKMNDVIIDRLTTENNKLKIPYLKEIKLKKRNE